jgi:hypothetical protein
MAGTLPSIVSTLASTTNASATKHSGWNHFKRPLRGLCKRPRRGGRYHAEVARPGIYRAVFAGDAGPSVRVR